MLGGGMAEMKPPSASGPPRELGLSNILRMSSCDFMAGGAFRLVLAGAAATSGNALKPAAKGSSRLPAQAASLRLTIVVE